MRRHSTATLMGLTKEELVEYVRMAEHNQEVAEETLNQQAENVKDWIPVVRCKDCKHWRDNHRDCTDHEKICAIGWYVVGENGYCCYGEKKEN